ncbi:hypothetical protein HPG69_004096, partial [Diceros bicornis minor]
KQTYKVNLVQSWPSRGRHHGSRHLPQQRWKGSSPAQGSQEPAHLPKAIGRAVQVSGQTHQLHLPPSCAEEVLISRANPSLLSVSWTIWKTELPGGEDQTTVVVGAIMGDVPKQSERASGEQLHPEPHPQGWRREPYLRPACPGLPPELWHHPPLRFSGGLRGVQAFGQGPGSTAQPRQTLHALQGLQVRVRWRPTGQPWLQKLTQILPCY